MDKKVDSEVKGLVYPNVVFHGKYRVDEGVIIGISEEDKGSWPKTEIGNNCIIRPYTIIHAEVSIGEGFETGPNVLIREKNVIGDDVVIWHGVTLNPGNILGDDCRIHAGCFMEEATLGKRVFLGPGVIFTNDPHPTNPPRRTCMKGAVVEDWVIIGANVTILPHLKIGTRAVIGAGSVVTKDIPPHEIWVGNPAKFLKKIEDVECDISGKTHYPYIDELKLAK